MNKLTDAIPGTPAPTGTEISVPIASLRVVGGWTVVAEAHAGIVIAAIVIALAVAAVRRLLGASTGAPFEIDQAELGLGDQTVTLRPNYLDRQIAYKIWVELSTRKVGLPIDLENDVVSEIYDSWFTFFQVTRELIKDIPVSRVKEQSTQKIIQLSVDVLNNGLRPHLTKWQARFRRWYEKKLDHEENTDLHPQEIQAKFPGFDEMASELLSVNARLMLYRDKMRELVLGKSVERTSLRSAQEDVPED